MRRRGFTLAEILVAIGLVLVLSGSIFGFLVVLLERREALHERIDASRAAAVLVERIEAAAATAIAGDPRVGGGIVGTRETLTVRSRRVMPVAGQQPPALHLLRIAREPRTGAYTAVFGPASSSGAPNATLPGPEGPIPLHPGIANIEFRYLSGGRWSSDFDSTPGGLPAALEISVWLRRPGDTPDNGFERALTRPGALDADPLPPAGLSTGPIGLGAQSEQDLAFDRPPDRRRVVVIPDGVDVDPDAGPDAGLSRGMPGIAGGGQP